MGLDTSTKRMIWGINIRLDRRHNEAIRVMNSTYYASCAPTNEYIIPEGQGQIDHCYDLRLQCKSVQIGPTKWLVWNFDEWYLDLNPDQVEDLSLHVHVPVFLRVRVLDVSKNVGKQFLKCSCNKWKRRGHPCECFFRVIDNGLVKEEEMLDLSMIDVRFWKAYNAFYGNGTEISEQLMSAQAQCFKYENEGIEISENLLTKITGPDNATYPILGPNTTMLDMGEMEYVLSNEVVTLRSFLDFTRDEQCNDADCVGESKREFSSLTMLAEAYMIALERSEAQTTKATSDETQDFVGDCMKMVRFVADDDRVDKDMMDGFLRCVNEGYNGVIKQLKDKGKRCIGSDDGNNTVSVKEPGSLQDSGATTTGKLGPQKKRIMSLGYN